MHEPEGIVARRWWWCSFCWRMRRNVMGEAGGEGEPVAFREAVKLNWIDEDTEAVGFATFNARSCVARGAESRG
jgi:hypothetical protein